MKGAAEVPYTLVAKRSRPRELWVFRLVVVISAAVTLSTFFPSYWPQDAILQAFQSTPSVADPASEWKDDIWPFRPPTPWDISTDFPYPRKLEYDVTEGTWLRLDVNPKNGDIVFDMLGDIYCLPGNSYATGHATRTRARPVLLGVPHDSDPHFSPDGKQLVFRSDAELGVENIWVTEWQGCDEMDVRSAEAHEELLHALSTKEQDEDRLAAGIRESVQTKERRLLREGRLNELQTNDPHFSPDGKQLVFRSDAELGVENIWVTEWQGCDEMDVRSAEAHEELLHALSTKEQDEDRLAAGIRESVQTKERRLLREGRLNAHRVTNETYRWVSDARFHPSGKKVIATKWYTSERSLGAGEGWEYDVLTSSNATVETGAGTRLVSRTLPLGWSSEDYGDQQIGPEQFIWRGEDSLIYAKNVIDSTGAFSYSKDVHSGIYAIFSTNLTTQQTTTVVGSSPGGASRPELSRDGRTLAFVRRVRDKEALVLKDLETGSIHHVWHGLTYDLTTVSAPMGTYPSFAFTPKDDAIIIWAAGQIYHIPLSTNSRGERTKSETDPTPIPFTAHIEKRLAETRESTTDLVGLETAETQRVRAFTDLRANEVGSKVTFQAAGVNYVYSLDDEVVTAVPVLHEDAPYHSPSFVPGAEDLIVHARWSDTEFTTFEIANTTSGDAYEVTGLPLGRYYSPFLCSCSGTRRKFGFIKSSGDYLSGNIIATAGAGLYVGDIVLPSGSSSTQIKLTNVTFISAAPAASHPAATKLRFLEKNAKILVQQSNAAFVIDLAGGPGEDGEYAVEHVARGEAAQELVAVLGKKDKADVAFVDLGHVYFAPRVHSDEAVWSKPGRATKRLARLSLDGGHGVVFSGDGKKVFWLLGPYLHTLEVSKLHKCKHEIKKDGLDFGIACTKDLLQWYDVKVEYTTDVARLKKEAAALSGADEQARAHADFLVFSNATLLTMESGNLREDVLHDALLVTRGGSIEAIVGISDGVIPYGATVIDAQGGYIVPGYIDVHAHWEGFTDYFPSRSWELETFLAYGVTTVHNPSAHNVLGSWERFRVERGQEAGPRIFHVGGVLYGAGAYELHEDVTTMAEAYAALIRIKAEGGPASLSYKNYNLPSRASRQRLLLAARNLSMLCFPEGGMNYDWDQTYIVDGMTTVEHALPVPKLYDDVLTLFALSGTASTPTHLVNYGGAWGEQIVWALHDVPNDPKLRQFTRHDILEAHSESTSRPMNSFALFNTSESTAKMVHMGMRAHIGAHGEPPLGLNYHAEMFFTQQGGLTNYEVIRAATSDAAKTLGLFDALGSLTPGKLADFVVYPPGFDVLGDTIRGSQNIRYVVRGGRVWEAETMTEVWPVKGRRPSMPPINPE